MKTGMEGLGEKIECEKETQSNFALILFSIGWEREKVGGDLKILLLYPSSIKEYF